LTTEDDRRVRLRTSLELLGLDSNWMTSVIALCGQEIAIRKKLESLGVVPAEQDFQKIAEKLIETLKLKGLEPPDILLSLARAYPHIRGKLVHWGYKTRIYEPEVDSIVTNTAGLIDILFREMPQANSLAETFLNIEDNELKSKIDELDSRQKKNVVLALIQKYVENESTPFILGGLLYRWEKRKRIKQLSKLIIASMRAEEVATILDIAIQKFGAVVPDYIMEELEGVCDRPSVINLLRDKGYIDFVASCFSSSHSFEQASINAKVIAKLSHILTIPQIEQVFQAIASNDQIRYSFGAQAVLPSFIALHKSEVDPALFEKVQQNFPPK